MAKVTGSLPRRITFWAHLVCGVVAGILILLMSATGVLLTYERQVTEHAARRNNVSAPAGTTTLSADALAQKALELNPAAARGTLVFKPDPSAPVRLSLGREGTKLLNPYTGALIDDASEGTRAFFEQIEQWHRWLGSDPDSVGTQLMNAANLLFLFIVVSGIYLWLPAAWKWPALRARLLFSSRYVNGKMRDYCWHHVFSFWVLIPLFIVVSSGVVISLSYPWASRLVYAAYGETPPQRGGPGPGAADVALQTPPDTGMRASRDALLHVAKAQVPEWQSLSLPLDTQASTVRIAAELPWTAPRALRRTVTVNAMDASVLDVSAPQGIGAPGTSPGQRARMWFRFAHTGEQYGFIGQTIAGIASLAACFLVYTGIALAYRRLIVPLYRR